MSFGQPFSSYGPSLQNHQLLLAAAAAASAAGNISSSSVSSIAASKSTAGSAPSDPSVSTASGQSASIFTCPPSSSANSGGHLLTHLSEGGEMSAEALRLLASAGGHHLVPPPPPPGPQSLMPSTPSQPAGAGAGPPMPPMFAGLPSLDPYRLPPPPFGLYSGGISPAGGPLDLKVPDGMPPPPFAHPAPSAITPFYYDPAFGSGYPYAADRFGNPLDLNGARRKNATRETTAALKAWLYEHRKNPYPTKGEKIMLAIITKMTLTQVSTWFANARRRLKKENKMTWSPRNRPGEDDDGVDGNSTTQENSGGPRPGSSLSSLGDDARDGDDDDAEELGPDTVAVACNLDEENAKRLIHGSMKAGDGEDKSEASGSVKRLAGAEEPSSSPKKPKIWSIAETVASPDSSPQKAKPPAGSPHQQQQQQGPYHFTFPPWPHMAAAAAFAGRNPLMLPPQSTAGAPAFPFGAMPPAPFATPVSMSSLPHPHQLRPELFARNFFAPVPPSAQMMNAAAAATAQMNAATGLPGFLNGFSFGCGPPSFPFGFGFPGAAVVSSAAAAAPTTAAQQQQQPQAQQNGVGSEVGASIESGSDLQQESKARAAACAPSVSPVSSNGGRRSSTSSQEPKANTSS